MSEQERVDGLKGLSLVGEPSERYVLGEPLGWSDLQRLQAAVASFVYWKKVVYLEAVLRSRTETRGRKREHTVADWLLVWTAARVFGSVRRAVRQLQDPQIMLWLHLALLKAWPNHPERRLSYKPITRSQFSYFRGRYLDSEVLDHLKVLGMHGANDTALQIDLFDPSAGTWNDPDTTQVITGDASWLRTMAGIHNPTERNKSKYDPDAVYFHDAENRTARGHKVVSPSARGPYRQERVVFWAEVKPPGITEDDLFYEQVRKIIEHSPEIRNGLRIAVYDMAMDSENHDNFLDDGILSHSRVSRTKDGKPASCNLGAHNFNLADGSEASMVVTAVNGAPTLDFTTGDGDDWYVPLTLKQVIRIAPQNKKKEGRYLFYIEVEIPNREHVPKDLVGATTRIRVNSRPEEIEAKPHRRRTRALRVFPEDVCEQDKKLIGVRQDSESNFSTYKQGTPFDRSRTASANRLQLDLLAYLHITNTTAVVAHHNRTQADISRWFGQYNPLDPYELVRNLDPNQLARSIDPKGLFNPLELHQLIRNLDPEKLKPSDPQPGKHKPGKQKPKAA